MEVSQKTCHFSHSDCPRGFGRFVSDKKNMNMNKYLAGCCLVALLATSCASKGNQQEKKNVSSQQTTITDSRVQVTPKHAEGFQLTYKDD